MIEARHRQRSFAEGFLTEAVDGFWDDWMRAADDVLDDEDLVAIVYEALRKRRAQSRTRGRLGFPAEVVLRVLLLKHIRQWSFVVTEREIRTNLLYREFTRVRGGKVPDAKTLGRLAQSVGPTVVASLHQRIVAIAQARQVIAGRKMRVDTTVVETNIHYPTDSSLLGDGVRVLTRLMKRATAIAGATGTRLRDRTRSVKYRLLEIGRASRTKGAPAKEKLQGLYRKLLVATSRVVGQAKRFAAEIAQGVKRSADVMQQAALDGLKGELEQMLPRVRQVMRQTRARGLGGDTRVPGKLVSLFEPTTEIIRKGKASKPTEFGKLVKIQVLRDMRKRGNFYAAFATGEVDTEIGGPIVFQKMRNEGVPLRIIATGLRQSDLVIVTADPSLKSLPDLKGKTLAADMGSQQYQVAAIYGRSKGLTLCTDVTVVQASFPLARTQLGAGRVDASMVIEPIATMMLKENPRYQILVNGGAAWREMTGAEGWELVAAMQDEFIKRSPGVVERWIAALKDVQAFIKQSVDAADAIVARTVKLPPGVFKEAVNARRWDFDVQPAWGTERRAIWDMFERAVAAKYLGKLPDEAIIYAP